MAVYKCSACGYEKESRCKPRKCPECEAKDTFTKVETPKEEKWEGVRWTEKKVLSVKQGRGTWF